MSLGTRLFQHMLPLPTHTHAHTHTYTHTESEQTAKHMVQFEQLCEMKIKITEERNDIVMQAEEERIRYGRKREVVFVTGQLEQKFIVHTHSQHIYTHTYIQHTQTHTHKHSNTSITHLTHTHNKHTNTHKHAGKWRKMK